MSLSMLKKRSDFVALKSGVAHVTRGFILQAKKREPKVIGVKNNAARFGITVTNQTASGFAKQNTHSHSYKDIKKRRGAVSVNRNRIKRRLREVLRLTAPKYAQEGVDYVIIGRKAALTLNFEILLKDLEKSFQNTHRKLIPSGKENANSSSSLNQR